MQSAQPAPQSVTPREIARASGSNLAAALFWMPRTRRRDMHAFYAFCRLVDDDADDPGLDNAEKHRRLDRWNAAISAPQPGEHPCMSGVRDVVRRYDVPVALLEAIVAGVRMDVEPGEFEDFEALRLYSHRVAGAVGLVSIRIFGCVSPESEQYAETLGQALQLTNIIRDVGVDLRNGGRIYLPTSDIEDAGYSRRELQQEVRNEAFLRLMNFEAGRAAKFFEDARGMATARDWAALFPARLMAAVYQSLLRKIVRTGFPVFGAPAKLTPLEKAAALIRTVTSRADTSRARP